MTTKIIITPENPKGLIVALTAEEEAQRVADAEASVIAKEARDAEDAQKATDKASAKAKLIAGEALTEVEADAIVI